MADISFDDLIPAQASPTPDNQDSGGGSSLPDLGSLEQRYNLPSGLLTSVMKQESGGDPNAVSGAGAQGLFQFMPKTAKQYGIDPLDPNQAAEGAARMYADLSKKYEGDVPSMLAAYNWGQGNLDKNGLGKAPKETRDYINNIMGNMGQTKQVLGPLDLASQDSTQTIPSSPKDISFDDLVPKKTGLLDQISDIGKSAASSAARSVPKAAMWLGDTANAAEQGVTRLAGAAKEGLANVGIGEHLTPEQAEMLTNPPTPFAGSQDVINAAAPVIKNAIGADINYKPKTEGGNLASGAVSMLPFALNPEAGIGRMALAGTGSELGREAGEKIGGEGSKAEELGSLAGGIAGAASPEIASMLPEDTANTSRNIFLNNEGAPPPKQQPLTSSNIRDLASRSYDAADALGGTLTPKLTNDFIDKASQVLPQTPAGKAVMGETSTTKLVNNLESLRDKPLSLAEAQEIDSALGEKANSEIDPRTGRLNAEGNRLQQIQQTLRDSIENAGPNDISGGKEGFDAWSDGRKLWSAQLRMNDIQRIMTRAEQMDNPVTGIKTGFRTLASNPARLRGYTPQEVSLINRAAKTGIVTDALRVAGSRLNPIIAGGVGSAGGPLGASVGYGAGYATSAIARGLANKMQTARGNAVMNAIANRQSIKDAGYAKGGLVNTNPTEKQKQAGNYKKAHVRLHGMEIAIENPKGSIRSGQDKSGKSWRVEMPSNYGYIKGHIGADKENMDVYVGEKPHSGRVYVVNQVHDHNGQFDEHKVMLGFSNKAEALDHYKKAFSDGKGSMRIGSVVPMSVQELKDWLKKGDTKKRVA